MEPFRTILFAADYSANSMAAFRMACSLAADNKTRLVVLHAFERDAALGDAPLPAEARKAEQRKMAQMYAPSYPIEVEYRTRQGHAADSILDTAREIGSDLIVLGTHGRTGLRRLIAGSIASSVLHRAQCPVLALRAQDGSPRADEIGVILHPTDFSSSSETAQVVARSLARDLGARLVILHVIPVETAMEGTMAAEVDPALYRDAVDAVRQRLDGPDLKHVVETMLTHGFAAEEIVRVASELRCDLIVMGTHGRTGLGRLLMGSVAEGVLPKAECPLLVVKPGPGTSAASPGQPKSKSAFVY
jgi:nucleotide-binding universal stress UspA family protein